MNDKDDTMHTEPLAPGSPSPAAPTASSPSDETGSPGGRHPVDVGHLVMGLAFAGLLAVWLLVQAGLVGTDDVEWLLPVPWLVAGGGGLLAILVNARRRRSD